MTVHARKQIRDAIKTKLTGLTTTTTHVYNDRTNPLAESELPGLLIGADKDHPSQDTVSSRTIGDQVTGRNREQLHTYAFPIRGEAMSTSALEDLLDTIASEVETALFADPLLGGLAFEMRLMGTETDVNGDGNKPVGKVVMSVEVDYWSVEGAPNTITNT